MVESEVLFFIHRVKGALDQFKLFTPKDLKEAIQGVKAGNGNAVWQGHGLIVY